MNGSACAMPARGRHPGHAAPLPLPCAAVARYPHALFSFHAALRVFGLILLLVGGPCLIYGAGQLRTQGPSASIPAEEEVNEEHAVAFAATTPDVVETKDHVELPSNVGDRLLACASPEVEVPPPKG